MPAKKSGADALRAMQKAKKAIGQSWQKAAKTEKTVKGAQIPPGLIRAKGRLLSAEVKTNDKGQPYILFTLLCLHDDARGAKFWKRYPLYDTEWKTKHQSLEALSSDLQILGYETYDHESVDDLFELLEQLNDDQPYFLFNSDKTDDGRVWTAFQDGLGTEDGKGEDDEELLDEDEEPHEDDKEEEPLDEDEEPEDEEPEDEETEIDEDEEPLEPETDDVVLWKAPRTRSQKDYTVVSVNRKNKTVTLEREGKKYPNIAWSELEYEDE